MGILSYYLATSLDGYMARKDGSVDWLNPYQMKLNTPYDYEEYYKTVSMVIMGRKTWDVAKSFEPQPYSDRQAIIFSNNDMGKELPTHCKLMNKVEKPLINKLKSETSNRVWLVGGANLASQLLELDLVDEIIQTIVPVSIGHGIYWIQPHQRQLEWNLSNCFKCDQGVVQLVYQRKT